MSLSFYDRSVYNENEYTPTNAAVVRSYSSKLSAYYINNKKNLLWYSYLLIHQYILN